MKRLLLLVFILLILPIVAAEIEVADEAVKSSIIPDESAEYALTIKNRGDVPDVFGISVSDINWREKVEDDFLEVGAGGTGKTKVELIPNKGLKAGRYSINLRIYSRTNPIVFKDHMLIVDLIPYNDLVTATLEANPKGLDPRRENLLRLNLKNRHSVELKNVNIELKSELFGESRNVNLGPAELRSEEFTILLDEDTREGAYDVKILVKFSGNTLVEKTEKITVGFYEDISETVDVEEGFLINKKKIVKRNSGNVDADEIYRERFNSFESFFTNVYPEPSSISREDDLIYYEWRFRLAPGENYKIDITTNYRNPLSILIVLIVVAWLAYATFGSGIRVKKKVLTFRSGRDVDMKIMIVLKNIGKGKINSLNVIDYLPTGAKLPTEYGTLRPNRHKKTSKGNGLVWKLNDIVGGEERVLSYRVKVRQEEESIYIPRAIVKYKRKGRISTARSNANRIRT